MDKMKILKLFVAFIFIILAILIIIVSLPSNQQTKEKIPSYTIVSEVNDSSGNIVRYNVRAVTSKNITHEQIQLIAKNITKYVKSKIKFNALSIMLYGYHDNTSDFPTIALITYAPYGDWNKAGEVKAGDYSKFKYVITYYI